jgi:hypothetical protein
VEDKIVKVEGRSREPWEERFPRYAHNANAQALFADKDIRRLRRAALFHHRAAGNAQAHGDAIGAELYEEMALATLDAADAMQDTADTARRVSAHYQAMAEREIK